MKKAGKTGAKGRAGKSGSSSARVAVGVGTSSGGYLLLSDFERKKWRKIGPFLKNESVNCLTFDPKTKTLFAATHTDGVLVSKDVGKTWKQSSRGLHVRKAWTLEFDGASGKNLYAGTQYGHLYSSQDRGANWEEVTGLFEAPNRKEWGVDWGFGTVGLCIHTIKMDPNQANRFYIVTSGAGPYRTDDSGKSWKLLNQGVLENCPVGSRSYATTERPVEGNGESDGGEAKRLAEHLAQVHKCTHKLAISSKTPGLLFQQNHCGVYRSTDAGEHWEDISPGDEHRHGFPLALVENESTGSALFTVPAYQGICKKHNSCIRGELAVYRTLNAGKDWEKLTNGLPQKNNHTCILRDAMSTDRLENQPGVYFGTTTGEVYGTTDLGDTWSVLLKDAGRVQGVSSFILNR
ncbi:MAG TPA: hypothetical protein VFF30_04775 [Nitrososphaerales archaeon]|nr:hypothetical protein [Nitrososphaerales archaeon]